MDQENPKTIPRQNHPQTIHSLPEEVCEVFQWKYNVDGPWWRRWYFRCVYLPFARFSFHVVRIVPVERIDPDGSLSWKEEQGVWLDCADAEREAAKYQFGGWRVVRFNAPESEGAIYGRSHFPNSDQWHEYERSASKEQAAVARGLHDALNEADQVIQRFRTANSSRA